MAVGHVHCHSRRSCRGPTRKERLFYYYYNMILSFSYAVVRTDAITIKSDVQKDQVFSLVGSFFVRFSHGRNNCLTNAQV